MGGPLRKGCLSPAHGEDTRTSPPGTTKSRPVRPGRRSVGCPIQGLTRREGAGGGGEGGGGATGVAARRVRILRTGPGRRWSRATAERAMVRRMRTLRAARRSIGAAARPSTDGCGRYRVGGSRAARPGVHPPPIGDGRGAGDGADGGEPAARVAEPSAPRLAQFSRMISPSSDRKRKSRYLSPGGHSGAAIPLVPDVGCRTLGSGG